MTKTVTIDHRLISAGPTRRVEATVDITSYTASGEPASASDFNLRTIRKVNVLGPTDNGFIVRYDGTNFRAFAPVKVTHNAVPGGAAVNFVDATNALESNVAGAADQFVAGQEVAAGTDVGAFGVETIGV